MKSNSSSRRKFNALVAAIASALAFATAAQSEILNQDHFVGAPGSLVGQGGGIGWGGSFPNWNRQAGDISVVSGSLPFAGNSALSPMGNKIIGTGTGNGGADIAFRQRVGAAAFSVDNDATYFATFLVNRNSTPGPFTTFIFSNNGESVAEFGLDNIGRLRISLSNGGEMLGAPDLMNPTVKFDTTYQLLAKFQTFAGTTPDVLSLRAFEVGAESLPGSEPIFSLSVSGVNNQVTGPIPVWVLASGANSTVDGFTVATQYSDVATAPVPEPTTVALLGLAGVACLTVRRRFNKSR